MAKGETVFYSNDNVTVRARVKTMHRDGSVTVEALFFHCDGKDVPGYLGYCYRVDAGALRLAA